MLNLSSMPRPLFLLLLAVPHVLADPATPTFFDCFDSGANVTQKLTVSTIYAQVVDNPGQGPNLNLTVLGTSPQDIVGFTNASGSLTTLFTSTSVLTLNAFTNSSYFCSTLRPPSPLPALQNGTEQSYCPIPAGPFAFSSTIPLGSRRALTTLTTRLRAVDPLVNELLCIDVITTPLDPDPNSPYGSAKVIFWSTIALAIAYWVVVGLARIVSARERGIARHDGMWSRAQSAGFIIASAISGERLATSPALIRFCTPSMRDVFFHTQWCAVLAMVAVQWPPFVYPLLTQTAWSTLSYNITLLQSTSSSHHWNPLSTVPYSPPSNFASQLDDISSPLYVDSNLPNTLFTLPTEAVAGISSFAYTLGIRPQDLFPNCLLLFLGILATVISVSILIAFVDRLGCLLLGAVGGPHNGLNPVTHFTGTRSPGFSNKKDGLESFGPSTNDENKVLNGQNTVGLNVFRTSSGLALPLSGGGTLVDRGPHSHRAWWRFNISLGSFHSSVLHGILVRILLLFHLPITIFSSYQMTLPRGHVSLASKALAGLSFGLFSVLLPTHLVVRVKFTTTNKLYAETNTLLSFGPLYNHYRHGSQLFASLLFATNLASGVTIGAGQHSGTAQAIVILLIEVVSALVTSIWLPWGTGAGMGLISFLFCVARIVVAVLLVILTPTVNVGPGPAGWVAYGILVILGLVFVALSLMLVVKLAEAFVRVAGGIGFNRSKHEVDSGLFGACGLLCGGPRKRPHKREPRRGQGKHSYPATPMHPQHAYHDSEGSSFVPPVYPSTLDAESSPKFPGSTSRKGSANSGPPSVLKPEHAMRPYKEDDEDEGYIMGAWQRVTRPGYAQVFSESPQPSTPTSELPKPSLSTTTVAHSGFSRVGGGRAHIDTPYAITAGSTHTFPSIGQQSFRHPNLPYLDDSPLPSLSTVNQYDLNTLPPGAMQPSHTRTKSQSAVIEGANLQGLGAPATTIKRPFTSPGPSSGGLLHPLFLSGRLPADHIDADSEHAASKKRPWYRIMRKRALSTGSPPTSPLIPQARPVDEEFGGFGNTSQPQPVRSFVVIRKTQPGRSSQPGSSDPKAQHATT